MSSRGHGTRKVGNRCVSYTKKIPIPGTSYTVQPGYYNSDSHNIVYLLMSDNCDSGNYIGETSSKLCFRLNSHKKSIGDNSRGFQVAVHFNQPDHSLNDLRCAILRGDFKTTAHELICEQTFIHKLKEHSKGLNQIYHFYRRAVTFTCVDDC